MHNKLHDCYVKSEFCLDWSLNLCNRAKEGDTVLDVCCGSGDLAFLLSEKVGISGKVCFPHLLLVKFISPLSS